MAPISRPLEPMNAKYRGRGCAIDSSRIRGGVVEGLEGGHADLGQLGLQEPPHTVVERRLLGPEPVEAAPGLLHEPGRVTQDLLPRRVQAQRPFGLGRHGSDVRRTPPRRTGGR